LLQIHLVHWNEDLYDNFEDAAKREDGIVIIAVFVKVKHTQSLIIIIIMNYERLSLLYKITLLTQLVESQMIC